jgi:Icc-related predicted phosphoesterase
VPALKPQITRLALLLLVPLLAACPEKPRRQPDARGRKEQSDAARGSGATNISARAAAKPPDAAKPATPGPRYERCATLSPDGKLKPVSIFGLKLVPRSGGAVLRAESPPPADRRLVLGVLGDTKEALPATLKHLDRLVAWFRLMGVSAVVVLGGIDASFEGTREVLGRLQRFGPVLALPGDRESRSGFQAAAEAHRRVVDLVRVRALSCPRVLGLIAVPGYHLPHHLHAREQGCSYGEEEIRALVPLARKLPAPRVLVAHTPPRGRGARAVDRAFGKVNIGDPKLSRLMREAEIPFGLFAHVHESAGHATTLSGEPVPERTWSTSLLLNVGSADSVLHEDLEGNWSRGTAALFELEKGRARYRMVDIARLPKAGAEKKLP